MRHVPAIWDAWASGQYVGERRPATRVTVERGWSLKTTGATVGTWNRGPARWYQDETHDPSSETEIPYVLSVNMNRAIDSDAGSCDIVVKNLLPAQLGDPEMPVGQFGNLGALTWDHGVAQDAKARWGHTPNEWSDVLAPNALLRTYQGFGGHDKSLEQAIVDGNVVLNGVWLVDDITVTTDGTLSVKCRDVGKLLLDQQLFPPLVPEAQYPLSYKRWDHRITAIPADSGIGDTCFGCSYGFWDSMFAQLFNTPAAWHSSTDETYGEYNTWATGHPPSDAFDITYESADAVQAVTPGYFGHHHSYWLSEPKSSPTDWVWIEFSIEGGAERLINSIYYHSYIGPEYVQVSVFENGEWAAPQVPGGGTTVHGVPFVSTFVPAGPGGIPGDDTNQRPLPRDYNATRVRLTISNLILSPEGGYRAGARKIMACHNTWSTGGNLVFAGTAMPVVVDESPELDGYWQARANGHVYAFGDSRTYPANSPATAAAGVVVAMAVHPTGRGYWVLDNTGRVTSHGEADHFGDLEGAGRTDLIDIAPALNGNGYWLLAKTGEVFTHGDSMFHGDSTHSAIMPTGVPAFARSIASHPATQGYWVVWSDGHITAHNLTHHGHATDRTGFTAGEYITRIRRTSTGLGYWVLSGSGKVQAKGDAVWYGHAPANPGTPAEWFMSLTWDLIPSPKDDKGYAIIYASGHLAGLGDATPFTNGSVGSGTARQRFDGNYKDWSDIIRELLLWSGFNLRKDPQPTTEKPTVYGNIETTGAWSDAALPPDMFDKRPVMDAIKQIREIVGYLFFIDAEGGARFESPNWWAVGNYLIDGTPYGHIPEIDESTQLTQHSVVRSASDSRSRLLITNSNPYPAEPGKPPPKGVISTEIVPRSAPDLRGLVVPAMWTNKAFLKPAEQQIMAELVDLRSWFARRRATVTCTANPLIDVNDQVRVIERQTGEVYVHYVRGIAVSHDLMSGDFTMNLTTNWLGGSPYGVNQLFRAGDTRPQHDGHWLATIGGYTSNVGTADEGVYAYGNAKLYERHQADSHLDLIVSMRSTPTGEGYYTLDRHGKVLTYGDAVHRGDTVRTNADVVDMALTPSGDGYWVVQEDGQVFTFGDAVDYGHPSPVGNMANGQPLRVEAIESHPTTMGYWVMITDGQVHAYNLLDHGSANRDRLNPIEHFTCLRRTSTGNGYWVLSAGGVVQGFGNAPELGDAERYPDENWVNGLCWQIIPGAGDGYAVVHSDSTTETFSFPDRTPVAGLSDRYLLWAVVTEEAQRTLPNPDVAFGLSIEVMKFLKNTGSPAAINAAANGFGTPQEITLKAL